MGRMVAGTVAAVLLLGSCGGDDDGASRATTTVERTTTDTPRTTVERTTTTTVPRTTTTLSHEQMVAAVASKFEETRIGLAKAIEDSAVIDRVDRIEFDPAGPTYVFEMTSGYSTDDYITDQAWDLTGEFATIWEPEVTRVIGAGLHLVLSGRTWDCSSDFMARVVDRRATRSDWEAEC